jgi:CCR4-NOT transcriptional complex subunit CAF120
MFEHATLQEAYTGSLIAGKGKSLNNIRVIMERTKLKTEDWTRVRFGAGTPWRRCWCVITPPDEKEYQKLQKSLKKKSAYERGTPILKGNVKFYDTKKTKKVQPIATINDAYSAYAIYPQSKPLIDQSTLVKVEGNITIHSTPETTMEGFVFVMPETHPAVSGFEMMLRWLFPLYDIFSLYGRPNRLIADTRNTQSLMFALPQERRYGFLEILDVATLIHENGSQTWTEKEWRARLKELSLARITKLESTGSRQRSRASSYRGHRNSFPSRTGTLRYDDSASIRSSPSFHHETGLPPSAPKPGSAPPGETPFQPPGRTKSSHNRSVSDIISFSTPRYRRSQNATVDNQPNYPPSRLTYEAPVSPESPPPVPPAHDVYAGGRTLQVPEHADSDGVHDRSSSESDRRLRGQVDQEIPDFRQDFPSAPPMAPVAAPPAFSHEAGAKPVKRPHVSPELRRANSRMSINTLSQLAAAGRSSSDGNVPPPAEPVASNPSEAQGGDRNILNAKTNGTMSSGDYVEDHGSRGVNDKASKLEAVADYLPLSKGI